MQRKKYDTEFKDKAVKQVIDKGTSFVDVTKRMDTRIKCWTWGSKFKKADEPVSNDMKVLQAEMAKLKAELKRTTKKSYIKKPLRTL